MILVTGGSASGKSAFAERLAVEYQKGPKLYIATMKPYDAECEARIRKHRLMRCDKGFETEECYGLTLENTYAGKYHDRIGLFECMSNYLSNCMFEDNYEIDDAEMTADDKYRKLTEQMVSELTRLDEVLGQLIVVTNEVFSDGTHYDPVTTQYLHCLGQCNRMLAEKAEKVYEVICGIAVRRKSKEKDGR